MRGGSPNRRTKSGHSKGHGRAIMHCLPRALRHKEGQCPAGWSYPFWCLSWVLFVMFLARCFAVLLFKTLDILQQFLPIKALLSCHFSHLNFLLSLWKNVWLHLTPDLPKTVKQMLTHPYFPLSVTKIHLLPGPHGELCIFLSNSIQTWNSILGENTPSGNDHNP